METVKVKKKWGDKEQMYREGDSGDGGGDVRCLFLGQSAGTISPSTTSQQLGSSEFKWTFALIKGFTETSVVHLPSL